MSALQTAVLGDATTAIVEPLEIRTATLAEADAIHALIVEHLAEGHLLPRDGAEIAAHVGRFLVAIQDDDVVGCAELAPLSRDVSEVRSLVVSRHARGAGMGQTLIDELVSRATRAGFEKLCAFTHAPSYFVHLGFSIVPHVWVPEKIVTNCHACPEFRRCGQYAVVRHLRSAPHTFVPLAALHA